MLALSAPLRLRVNKNATRPVARNVRQVAFAVANAFRESLLKGSAMRLEQPTIDAAQLYWGPPPPPHTHKLQRRHGRTKRAAGDVVAIIVEVASRVMKASPVEN